MKRTRGLRVPILGFGRRLVISLCIERGCGDARPLGLDLEVIKLVEDGSVAQTL
jgi:hypothetical protein